MNELRYGALLTGFCLMLAVSGTQIGQYGEAETSVGVSSDEDQYPYSAEDDKRGWNQFHGSWGKKAGWNSLHGSWGKRLLVVPVEGLQTPHAGFLFEEPSLSSLDTVNVLPLKKSWTRFTGTWGKRSNEPKMISPRSTNWSSLRGSWGKRSDDWKQFRGAWGKKDTDWDKFREAWAQSYLQDSNLSDSKTETEPTATQ